MNLDKGHNIWLNVAGVILSLNFILLIVVVRQYAIKLKDQIIVGEEQARSWHLNQKALSAELTWLQIIEISCFRLKII